MIKQLTTQEDLRAENKILRNLALLYDLRIRGLGERQIAKALGISAPCLKRMIEHNETIRDTYEDANMILCSQLRAVVIDRALGKAVDLDGNPMLADANLAFKVLTHIDPDFKNKPTEPTEQNITVEHIIRQLSKTDSTDSNETNDIPNT